MLDNSIRRENDPNKKRFHLDGAKKSREHLLAEIVT